MAQELAPTARAPPCLPSWRVSPQQMRMQLLDLNAACQTYYGEADWGPTVAYRCSAGIVLRLPRSSRCGVVAVLCGAALRVVCAPRGRLPLGLR